MTNLTYRNGQYRYRINLRQNKTSNPVTSFHFELKDKAHKKEKKDIGLFYYHFSSLTSSKQTMKQAFNWF